jgi:hypothetical protein
VSTTEHGHPATVESFKAGPALIGRLYYNINTDWSTRTGLVIDWNSTSVPGAFSSMYNHFDGRIIDTDAPL